MINPRPRVRGFEPHWRHCVVSLGKTHLSLLNTGCLGAHINLLMGVVCPKVLQECRRLYAITAIEHTLLFTDPSGGVYNLGIASVFHTYIREPLRKIFSYLRTTTATSSYIIEPRHEISNNVVCTTSKASDQPAHTRSLIRAFSSRLIIL